MNIATIDVNDTGLANITARVESLNRRAARHGMEPITMDVREVALVPVYGADFGASEPLYTVTIKGQEPRIDGWRLVARVEFNPTIGQVVRLAPGIVDDGSYSSYRTHEGQCEHCCTTRRRNDVFILEREGARISVGRNCLADFLRCGDASAICQWSELSNVPWNLDGEGRPLPTMPLARYLPIVSMLVRRLGWTSRSAAKDNPELISTADDAQRYLYGRNTADWIVKEELFVSPNDSKLAQDALDWVVNVDPTSEYLSTIRQIGCAGIVDMVKLDGYAASIISAYKRAIEKEKGQAARAVRAGFVGEVKERLRRLEVTVVRVRYVEGQYGTRTILAMEYDGKALVWFASGSVDVAEGDTLTLDGTVKEHKDGKWGQQTVLTRCKII